MSKEKYLLSNIAVITILAGSVVQSIPVNAQVALEEIVVTAQRREQSLQEVPISIEAISGNDLITQGLKNMEDLSAFVPGFTIPAPSENTQSLTIRGVGSSSNNWAIEQSVPIFVDGVHYGRGATIYSAFMDVDRIEVLRGPQPIFFGQNAAAGAISVISRKPGEVWEGYVNGELGNNDTYNAQFGVGGPVSDTMGMRVAGKYNSTDGYMTDVLKDTKFPHEEQYGGRLVLTWAPQEALDITAKVDYVSIVKGADAVSYVDVTTDARNTLGAVKAGEFTAIPGAASIIDRGDGIGNLALEHNGPWYKLPLTVFEGFGARPTSMADLSYLGNTCQLPARSACGRPYGDIEQIGAYMQADYRLANDILFTSQTSYTYLDRYFNRDGSTGGPFLVNLFDRAENQDQISQEFRLTSPTGNMFEWMGGLYWEQINLNTEGAGLRAAVSNVSPTQAIQGNVHGEDDRWLSAFGVGTVNMMEDTLSLDLGMRFTDIQKDGHVAGRRGLWTDINGNVIVGPALHGTTAYGNTPIAFYTARTVGEFEDKKVDYQVSLRWRPTSDISTYAKYATGLKAGGFDAGTTQVKTLNTFIFDSEKAENWELGMKGSLYDNRVNYNLTLFWTEFEGLQVAALNPILGESVTDNVGGQRTKGAEFGGQFAATERWTLGLSGSIMDAVLTSYPGANCTQNEVAQGVCTGPRNTIDRTGGTPTLSPDWKFTLRTEYWMPVFDDYKATFNAVVLFSDGYLYAFDELFVMKPHEDLNLSAQFSTMDDKWGISVWGRHILEPLPTHQREFDYDTEFETINLSQSQFMTYGISLKYSF